MQLPVVVATAIERLDERSVPARGADLAIDIAKNRCGIEWAAIEVTETILVALRVYRRR
jgi:hypothetical protein